MSVHLAPLGSCQDSDFHVTGHKPVLDHNDANLMVRMIARDTDGYLIARTPFAFSVRLVYENSLLRELDVIRDTINTSQYSSLFLVGVGLGAGGGGWLSIGP